MVICNSKLPDVKIVTPKVFSDERGFFFESFNNKFLVNSFVQDNHSHSLKNVLRGLHYQVNKPQGKLVRVVSGEIIDVAVDIRKSSPTFGKWVAEKLSATNYKQLWIPPGFAHGFFVLSDTADVLYKTDEYWYKEYDRSIRWNDPDLCIDWGNWEPPILSEKDSTACWFKDAELFD
jgi:dTDP-4-dehydrorhamnose 3,5-epimerase